MTELPLLSISGVERVGAVITANPKKSCKSTLACVAANHFGHFGLELSIWQHDRHERLSPCGKVTHIELARAKDVFGGDSAADLKGHEAFGEELETLAEHPNRMTLLDSSGPAAALLGSIFSFGRFNNLLLSQGCHALILVPLRTTTDVAEGALAMMMEMKTVMHDHFVVPVPIFTPAELPGLERKHAFWQVMKQAEHGVIPLPLISPSAASGIERVPRLLSEIADPDSEEALKTIRRYTGYGRVEAGAVAAAAGSLVAGFSKGIAPLGYTPGA
jgi:hypothetical protein